MTISKLLVWVGILGAGAAIAAPQKYQGTVSGFGNLRNDDVMDLAAVFPSLTQEQILSFDFEAIMAPNEKMSAGPVSADVPGNTFVPRQRESYGWIPLTIVKDSFSVMLEPRSRNELFTMAFQAPFNDTVKRARAKAPKNEILKDISFNDFGFASARDWSRESQPFGMQLGYGRPDTTRLNWTRNALAQGEGELVIQAEETPMNRWIFSDMNFDPKVNTTLRSTNWDRSKKLLAGRMKFGANDKFVSLRAWTPDVAPLVTLRGLPELLNDVRFNGTQSVTWNPDGFDGFVTLYVERKANKAKQSFLTPFEVAFDFPSFGYLFKGSQDRVTMQEWVPVENGRISLNPPLDNNDSLALIYLGGAEMNQPELSKAEVFQVIDLK